MNTDLADLTRAERELWQLRADNAALREQNEAMRLEHIAMAQDVMLLVKALDFYRGIYEAVQRRNGK